MTDTSRYEGWLLAHYDIASYTQGDMKDILKKDVGFDAMSSSSQTRILDNWFEFEAEVVVDVPSDFKELPAPKGKEVLSFWKKVKRLFWRRG